MSNRPSSSSAPPALERRLKYSGPALFSYGFRPFFLCGAIWSAAAIVLWIPQFMGDLSLPTAYPPLDWHVHEMLYGYVAAVVAGFLLTAIPNWTGRLPINGVPLAALATLWLAGRLAILFSAYLGIAVAALIDVAFLATLAMVALREIIAGRNWRNLIVLMFIVVLIVGNVIFHAEVYVFGSSSYGVRIGIAAIIMLISLVGGRIVPSFTRNWLARRKEGRLPAPVSRFDGVAIAVSFIALILWTALPDNSATGIALILAALVQAIRIARWAGERTASDRLCPCSPRRLRVSADRICAAWLVHSRSLADPKKRRYSRLDRRSHRADDTRGDDARHPWTHWTAAGRQQGDPDPLFVGGRQRCVADIRQF